jgi:hypothetical protein
MLCTVILGLKKWTCDKSISLLTFICKHFFILVVLL